MRITKLFGPLVLVSGMALLQSCIQDEPLNAECDIKAVSAQWLEQNRDILRSSEPFISNDKVSFITNYGVDRSALAPVFELTPGARLTAVVDGREVEANNGLVRDFNLPQIYTTHSEDGKWSKDYEVSFSPMKTITMQMAFENFENTVKRADGGTSTGSYNVWYEVDEDDIANPRRNYWATGNAGYDILGIGKEPADYPTASASGGVNGKCVKLVTRDTKSYGMVVKMPIAAGNIFLGEFKSQQAMSKPMMATRFGLPLVEQRPLELKGYYKYKAGEVYTDKQKNPCPDIHDTADIYAVVYEISTRSEMAENPELGFVPLNGNDVLSSDRIVLMARIDKPVEFEGAIEDLEASPWVSFNEPFKPMNDKVFDMDRLRDGGYAIALVATSSRQGAYFEGAIGSTLYIDELEIVWEGDE